MTAAAAAPSDQRIFSGESNKPHSAPAMSESSKASPGSDSTLPEQVSAEPPARIWNRIALFLVAGTLVYNMIEAGASIWAGVSSKSVALISFGLDSVFESLAALAMLYHVGIELRHAQTEYLERVERRVGRLVGATFLLLAAYVTAQSVWVLTTHNNPEESLPGIIIAATSLVVMPLEASGKMRAAKEIGSSALRAQAKETLACCYLSLTLLVGLGVNALFGWLWADPTAALLMVPWLIKEGMEGVGCIDDEDDNS